MKMTRRIHKVSHRLRRKTARGVLSGSITLALLAQSVVPAAIASSATRKPGRESGAARSKNGVSSKRKLQSVSPQAGEIQAALVNHAPSISGRVQGTVRQLTGENVTLNSAS